LMIYLFLITLIINKYCFMFSILLPTSKHKLHKYNPTATSLSWHTGVYKNKYIINNHGISVCGLISVEMFNSVFTNSYRCWESNVGAPQFSLYTVFQYQYPRFSNITVFYLEN
jgi:hypothetical protein